MSVTSLTAIFARDILLYYSYVQSYVTLAQKLFWFRRATMATERVGLYYGLRRSNTPSKHIAVTTTYMEMICALGLVVIMPQPTKYHHFGTSFFRDFLNSMILDKLSGYN